ncbi:hypothetical protein EGW08_004321 [Elysia chlorotica]|uniref:Uncharacterized protein n=1 Tax=Elysia chlorotica TaxID=188477 RepID=A0A3S1BGN0_ELYCH|nr:hypothetical protein EGW08_004321 [Elysia chlorotica]
MHSRQRCEASGGMIHALVQRAIRGYPLKFGEQKEAEELPSKHGNKGTRYHRMPGIALITNKVKPDLSRNATHLYEVCIRSCGLDLASSEPTGQQHIPQQSGIIFTLTQPPGAPALAEQDPRFPPLWAGLVNIASVSAGAAAALSAIIQQEEEEKERKKKRDERRRRKKNHPRIVENGTNELRTKCELLRSRVEKNLRSRIEKKLVE